MVEKSLNPRSAMLVYRQAIRKHLLICKEKWDFPTPLSKQGNQSFPLSLFLTTIQFHCFYFLGHVYTVFCQYITF